jgi:hypothetical protein
MIQYQTLNPFSQLLPGLIAHDQRRSNEPAQPSDAIIADPGQYQPVDISQVTGGIEQDVVKLGGIEKKMREVKLPPEAKKSAIKGYSKSFQSQMVPALAEYGITAEQLNGVLTSVKNGNPDGEGDLKLMLEATNNDPRVVKGLGEIGMKMQQLEAQNKQARVKVLSETLDNINTVQDKMGQYQGKSGIMNPQTKKVVDNELNYLKELTMLDPKAAEEHFGKIKARAASGGSKTWMQSVNTKGKLVTDRVASREEFLARNPGADPNQLYLAGKMGEATPIVAQAKVKSEEFKKETADLPEAPEQDAEPDDATKKLFLEKARDPKTKKIDVKKAEKMLKSKGWSIE